MFDRAYPKFIYYGLILSLWFAAVYRAAHDLWTASFLFAWTSFLALLFCIGRWRDKKPIRVPLGLTVLFYCLSLSLSLSHSYDLGTTSLELAGWLFTFLNFYLFINVMQEPQDVPRFFAIASLIVVPLAVIALGQQITGAPLNYGLVEIPFLGSTFRYGHWEIYATLVNSVVMAGFMLCWLLFSWDQAVRQRRYLVVFLAIVVTLVLARSWWALLASSLGFLLYYHRHLIGWQSRHKKMSVLGLTTIVVVLTFAFYVKTHHREASGGPIASYNVSDRWIYWAAASRMWKQNPWTGVGLGGFATAYPFFKTRPIENTRFAHSFFIQQMAETGFVGIAAFIFLIYQCLKLRLLKDPRTRRIQPLTVFDITLAIVLFYSLISINMDFLLNKWTFFLILGAALLPSPLPTYQPRPLWLATGGICLVLASAFWLPWLPASQRYVSGLTYEEQGNEAKASESYQSAVALDPLQADSYWRLARLFEKKFMKSRSPGDLEAARLYLRQAIQYKKDFRFLEEMRRLETLPS